MSAASRQLPRSLAQLTAAASLLCAINSYAQDFERPQTPANVRAEVYSSNSAEIRWDRSWDNRGVVAYRVYRGADMVMENDALSLYEAFLPAGPYSYQVSALDAAGNESARSEIVSIRLGLAGASSTSSAPATAAALPATDAVTIAPPVAAPPNAPAELSGGVSDGQITLQWREHETATGFNVYRANRYVATVFAPTYTGSWNASEPDYYVVAFDSNGQYSPRSPVYQHILPTPVAEPAPDPVAEASPMPATPENLGIEASGDTAVLLWDPVADSLGYNVYRNDVYWMTVFDNSVTDAAHEPEDPASYYVIAFNRAGFSTRSNTVQPVASAVADTASPTSASETSEPAGESAAEATTESTTESTTEAETAGEIEAPATASEATTASESEPAEESESAPDTVPAAVAVPTEERPIPPPIDAFMSHLELDSNTPLGDGIPSAPGHLRADLVSNDWADINWTPSVDDGEIVKYLLSRDDGVVYTIEVGEATSEGEQRELDKNWDTTSFIDCNYTRFYYLFHNCGENQPEPGETYTYTISAVDDDGNESAASPPLTITYHERPGLLMEHFTDMYLDGDDEFLFETDLSRVDNFIDQFELYFEDEFDQASLDTANWNTSLTWPQEDVINGEQQYFVDILRQPDFGYNPFVMTGDTLRIAAIPTPPELHDAALGQPFLSGALSSHDKVGFTYGYVEARLKVGDIPGMLSSFYLFRRWAAEHAPEIDIVEYLANNPYGDEDAFHTYHYHDPVNDWTRSSPTMYTPAEADTRFGDDYHLFSVLWEPGLVIWYIDGAEVQRLSGPQIGRQQMNIVLYLVTGSEWTPIPDIETTEFPLEYEIDYVRVYKRKPWEG